MKLRKLFNISAFLLVLCSCSNTPNLSLYTNEYQSFNEFKTHLDRLYSIKNEGEVFVFDPSFSNITSKEYKVIGVDYEHKHGHKDGGICDALYYREAFVLVDTLNTDETFVVSFGLKNEYIDDDLEWFQQNDSRYNYSQKYLGSESLHYVLTDSHHTHSFLWVKFKNNISEELVISILDNIKLNHKEAYYV